MSSFCAIQPQDAHQAPAPGSQLCRISTVGATVGYVRIFCRSQPSLGGNTASRAWQLIGKRAQQKLLDKPHNKLLAQMWMQLWKDQRVFGQTVVALKQADINTLLDTFEGGGSDKPKGGLTVLPRDFSVPVSSGNAVLVMRQARRELLVGYRQHEAGTYQSKLQQALSSLEHAHN